MRKQNNQLSGKCPWFLITRAGQSEAGVKSMKTGKNLIKKGHICHSKTFRFYSKAVEIYEKILVRKSRRDSKLWSLRYF